ncbi:MAG: P-loop NTPase [Verrucomicrobia bacterium]|jgi:MinD superfamily P-loop ATPase|nr:P-loop NTPase [Verrucomicrobiota bacterium]
MIITVASGKGGTGKTTFSVNLAYALANRGDKVRLLDCDVEEPNDHLFVKPDFSEESKVTVLKPVWDEDKCIGCGKCAEVCNYNAIAVVKNPSTPLRRAKVLIFNELCHSCGACTYVCPESALHEEPVGIGKVQASPGNPSTSLRAGVPFYFAHGLLNIGEALAPNVVQAVKTHIAPDSINILDASPGTACPVVKALDDADVAVLLTEPTPFGLNDLKLATAMTLKMEIPTGIVVNRSDGEDRIIADWAETVGVPIVGRIPFERKYAETYSSGNILVEWHDELNANLLGIYENLCALKGTPVAAAPEMESIGAIAKDASPFEMGNASDYKEVTVISGKGGTGKTSVTASFAVLSQNQVLADNDVDAADLHLLLTPQVREAHPFVGGTKATVDSSKCIGCGKCAAACHFDAFRFDGPANDVVGKTWQVSPVACEGCGLCIQICPVEAIWAEDAVSGTWFVSGTDYGPMVHARLGIAEENSGRLVTQVRNRAGELATELRAERILGDGPPGTGCPVIASVSGSDLVLIVTEPTVSGVHDMERVLDLSKHFGVPALVIINKADLNTEQAARIDEIAEQQNSRVIARIPFDRAVNDALMAGKTVIQYRESAAAEAIRRAWEEVQAALTNIRYRVGR